MREAHLFQWNPRKRVYEEIPLECTTYNACDLDSVFVTGTYVRIYLKKAKIIF